MKFKAELVSIAALFLIVMLGSLLLKLSLGMNWDQTYKMVTIIFQSSGLINLNGLNTFEKLLVFGLSISWAAFQLGIIVFLVNYLIQFLISRQGEIETRISEFIATYPIRQIFSIAFVSIIFFSAILIRTIERITWLDAFYFIIITISTVGFGDITATHPITKTVTIILVLNGITFIAFASQVIIDRIVNLQLNRQDSLPRKALTYSNHIIIAGYGSKGRRLSQLFVERGYHVVVVEREEDRAKLARINGFEVFKSDITKPALLELINLKESAGLFLLLSDDNLVIQAGIIARSISEDLDIYGEFLSVPTYNIARYAGINKPISLFVFLTNELQNYLSYEDIKFLQEPKDLRLQEASLGYMQLPLDLDYEGMFSSAFPIGEVSTGFNEIFLDRHLTENYEKPSDDTSHLLLAIDREELDQLQKLDKKETMQIERLIFAGYNSLVESLIERLGFPEENIVILWQNSEDQQILQQRPYKKYEWNLESGHLMLEQLIKERDLIICTFNDITSSLIVGVTLRNLKEKMKKEGKTRLDSTNLIQLVPYEYDIEPLMKVGAEVVFTPQQIISSAILSIFLKENNISPSLVFTNGHIYEHLVIPDDFFDKKRVIELGKQGYRVISIRPDGSETFRKPISNQIVQPGDRILIFVKNSKKERLDQQPNSNR